ncbi:MAG: hypothetical protein LBV27_04510 [Oscillospiraceae bacterium]|jgi:hypothetical protein|nr:hypothetical protein [Oscillospiraceae bacterium]
MKKMIYFCLFLFLFTYFNITASAAAVNTPADAVDDLMDSLRNWDMAASVSQLGEADDRNFIASVCEIATPSVLGKLQYTISNTKITENRAAVDIAVTAADIKSIAGEIMSQAIGYAALQKILGLPVSVEDFVLTRVTAALDDENLTTIKTNATVHLILGGDGAWKLDMSNVANLGFLEALTGGMVDFEEPVKAMISTSIG